MNHPQKNLLRRTGIAIAAVLILAGTVLLGSFLASGIGRSGFYLFVPWQDILRPTFGGTRMLQLVGGMVSVMGGLAALPFRARVRERLVVGALVLVAVFIFAANWWMFDYFAGTTEPMTLEQCGTFAEITGAEMAQGHLQTVCTVDGGYMYGDTYDAYGVPDFDTPREVDAVVIEEGGRETLLVPGVDDYVLLVGSAITAAGGAGWLIHGFVDCQSRTDRPGARWSRPSTLK